MESMYRCFRLRATGLILLITASSVAALTFEVSHLGFDLMRAHIVSQTIVHATKYPVRRDRPTDECCAFPSGHATSAFAAASVLERHFGYRASWPALAAATYVATSRLVDSQLSEIAAFDPRTNTIWVVGIVGVDVVDADTGTRVTHIDVTPHGAVNSWPSTMASPL